MEIHSFYASSELKKNTHRTQEQKRDEYACAMSRDRRKMHFK